MDLADGAKEGGRGVCVWGGGEYRSRITEKNFNQSRVT